LLCGFWGFQKSGFYPAEPMDLVRLTQSLRRRDIFLQWGDEEVLHFTGGDFFAWPALVRPIEGFAFDRVAEAAGVLEWRDCSRGGGRTHTVVTSHAATLEEFWDDVLPLQDDEPVTVTYYKEYDPTPECSTWQQAIKVWVALEEVDIADTYSCSVKLRLRHDRDFVLEGLGFRDEEGLAAYFDAARYSDLLRVLAA
jgi:hypothetical protein